MSFETGQHPGCASYDDAHHIIAGWILGRASATILLTGIVAFLIRHDFGDAVSQKKVDT